MDRFASNRLTSTEADRYLRLLGVNVTVADRESLGKLSWAHLKRVPFENLSKLHCVRVQGIRWIPDFDEYLDGIEKSGFGGTCYTNNYYMHLLLRYLDYDVKLCSADIAVTGAPPDGHMLNLVQLEDEELIIDVGYGGPFWQPVPRDRENDVEVRLGNTRYRFKPPDAEGRTKLEVYRHDQLVHGYLVKPHARQFDFFKEVITRSYGDNAPFLSRLMINRFYDDRALVLINNVLTEMTSATANSRPLETRTEIVEIITGEFGMPAEVAMKVLDSLDDKILFAA